MTTKILVCVNHRANPSQPSCGARGGETIVSCLEKELNSRSHTDIEVERIHCLGECDRGPNLRLAPGGPFYHQVDKGNIASLMDAIEEHLQRSG
jgi:(2Fe-2S) ferredoxin